MYKSAELIQDSDAELGDDEAFFARERELMSRANKAGEGSGTAAMLSHGTKKRVRKEGGGKRRGKRSKDQDQTGAQEDGAATEAEKDGGEEAGLSDSLPEQPAPKAKSKPRPRPKPKPKPKPVESDAEGSDVQRTRDSEQEEPTGWSEAKAKPRPRPRPRPRVAVESDAEEEDEPEKSVVAQNVSSEDE